ncbi:MAG: sigma-70 family RNA polymerase sigma factor [Candidatus Aureabacteria bacterium]|nr:sigma-70 family RNA polymerase sigma factor [Candidatus Auribacterota bacterium]
MTRDDFESLYAAHSALVWSLIGRCGISGADAEDLFLESWEAIFTALPSFHGRAKISTWIGNIVRNTCVDHLRKKRPRPCSDDELAALLERGGALDWLLSGLLPSGRSPGDEAVRGELKDLVRGALRELPPERRFIVEKWMAGFEYREIAELLAASGRGPVATAFVGKQLFLAKIALLPILKRAGVRSLSDIWE